MDASKKVESPNDACVRLGTRANIVSLMYHDIVPEKEVNFSGFRGADANKYKLDRSAFERHLEFLRSTQSTATDVFSALRKRPENSFVISFDDGGVGAIDAARALDRYGWPGHFLVTTDFIGNAGFLSEDDIRALARYGHVIGSHSCSHPRRMSACSTAQLAHEWRDSIDVLGNILGHAVLIASVPGGYFSREVASAAASSGLKVLFTSEPETAPKEVNGCIVLGRFSVSRSTSPENAAALVTGASLARWKQFATWNSKKLVKKLTGESYVDARRWLLNMLSHS